MVVVLIERAFVLSEISQGFRPCDMYGIIADTFNAKLKGWETIISLQCGDSKAPGA